MISLFFAIILVSLLVMPVFASTWEWTWRACGDPIPFPTRADLEGLSLQELELRYRQLLVSERIADSKAGCPENVLDFQFIMEQLMTRHAELSSEYTLSPTVAESAEEYEGDEDASFGEFAWDVADSAETESPPTPSAEGASLDDDEATVAYKGPPPDPVVVSDETTVAYKGPPAGDSAVSDETVSDPDTPSASTTIDTPTEREATEADSVMADEDLPPDTQTPEPQTGPPLLDPLPVQKYKAIVKRDSTYIFPEALTTIQNPESIYGFLQPINQNFNDADPYSISDPFRRWTMRMWFAHGWAGPTIERLPRMVQSPPRSSDTGDFTESLFGYFPFTSTRISPLTNNVIIFYDLFQELSGLGRVHSGRDYFRILNGRGVENSCIPLIYISDFGIEKLASDQDDLLARGIIPPRLGEVPITIAIADALEDVFRNTQNYKISAWQRSEVVFKRFNSINEILPSLSGAREFYFRDMIQQLIKPALAQQEVFLDDSTSLMKTTPKRHYDYSFEIPIADDLISITSRYLGSLAPQFEEYTAGLDPSFESMFPNLYMIDFANTGIEEYYKLLSLDGNIRNFPDYPSLEYYGFFDRFKYSPTVHPYTNMWINGVENPLTGDPNFLALADEYRSLIFSSYYKSLYNRISLRASQPNNSWIPMFLDVGFNFPTGDPYTTLYGDTFDAVRNNTQVTDEFFGISIKYDPIVHMANDTQITSRNRSFLPNSPAYVTAVSSGRIGLDEIIRSQRFGPGPFFDPEYEDYGEYSNYNFNKVENKADLNFKVERTWDIQEWFKLYCVPNNDSIEGSSWDIFFDRFPDQAPWLLGATQTWVPNPTPSSDEPARYAQYQNSIPLGGVPIYDPSSGGRPEILRIPSSDTWESCLEGSGYYLYKTLSDIQNLLNNSLIPNSATDRVLSLFRTYKEVVDGELARAEALFYRIEKRDAKTKELLHNFILPATLVKNGFRHIDAQIRYGAEYELRIYGYYMVVGNEYWYEDMEQPPPGGTKWDPVDDDFGYAPFVFRRYVDMDIEERERYLPTLTPTDLEIQIRFDRTVSEMAAELDQQLRSSMVVVASGEPGIAVDSEPGSYTLDELLLAAMVANDDMSGLIPTRGPIAPFDLSLLEPSPDGIQEIVDRTMNRVYAKFSELYSDAEVLTDRMSVIRLLTQAEYNNVISAEDMDKIILAIEARFTDNQYDEYVARRDEFESAGIFEDPVTKEPLLTQYSVAVNNRPHIVLVETNIFSSQKGDGGYVTKKILDKPPTAPDVDYIPYRSVKDRILVKLSSSTGEYVDKPKIINAAEYLRYVDIIVDQALNQDYLDGRQPLASDINIDNIEQFDVLFKNDDYPEYFEIYRIDFPPTSYRDFADGEFTVLDNTARLDDRDEGTWRDGVIVTSNSFIDNITPNKKYWYTSRVVDIHGNSSNPTGVIQLEMVDTGNSIYPAIEEYIFPKMQDNYTRSMRRYIRILPPEIQTGLEGEIFDSDAGAGNGVRIFDPDRGGYSSLGLSAAKSVWNRAYKLRIKSKTTGKKIDINFKFKQKRPKKKDLLGLTELEEE